MSEGALCFLVLTGLIQVTLQYHVYVREQKTWSEALDYCRLHHTDLSSIFSLEEDQALYDLPLDRKPNAWIGLHGGGGHLWRWSDGRDASFFLWAVGDGSMAAQSCVTQTQRGWKTKDCSERFYFYCFHTDMILVKESKTWEEAVERCHLQQGHLVSLTYQSALNEAFNVSQEALTTNVWTGLRYLADTWLWVDGEALEFQAWAEDEVPVCPAMRQRCGTLSLTGGHWEKWDCADKLNFICEENYHYHTGP